MNTWKLVLAAFVLFCLFVMVLTYRVTKRYPGSPTERVKLLWKGQSANSVSAFSGDDTLLKGSYYISTQGSGRGVVFDKVSPPLPSKSGVYDLSVAVQGSGKVYVNGEMLTELTTSSGVQSLNVKLIDGENIVGVLLDDGSSAALGIRNPSGIIETRTGSMWASRVL